MRRLVVLILLTSLWGLVPATVRADGWRLASLWGGEDGEVIDAAGGAEMLPPGSYVDLDAYLAGTPAVSPYAESGDYSLQWLPRGSIYKNYLAGTKESRFSMLWFGEQDGGALWDNTLGTRVGLWRYGTEDSFFPQGWQLDAEGSAQVRLDVDEKRDVDSVDFRGGLPLTYGRGPLQFKFGYYHLSAHLADEFLIKNPGYPRLNFSRDCLILGVSYYTSERWRWYAETAWAFHNDVSEQWEFQFGTEYAPIGPTGPLGEPFAAINGHLREEVDYGGSLTVQAGWAWRSAATAHLLRVGGHYYNGKSNQYSFHHLFEEQLGLGVWYDF